MIFKQNVLFSGQLYLLSIQSCSEFCGFDSALSERVMILEELSKSNSVSFNHVSNFLHKSINSFGSCEVNIEWLVSGLSSSVSLIDHVFQNFAVVQERKVLNISEFVSIYFHDGGQFSIRNLNSKESDGLLELFWGDLKMIVSILILEETLGIESFSVNQELKLFLNISHVFMVSLIWLTLAIDRLSSRIIKRDIYRLLQILFSEYFIDAVTELSPANVGTCLWCLESFAEKSEFSSWKHDFTHVQSNSELGFSDISTSQFIEISKELSNSNSLFFASLSQLSNDIINIIRLVLLDINSSDSWLGLWIVIERVVVASSDTE